jgi:hypothetical protein
MQSGRNVTGIHDRSEFQQHSSLHLSDDEKRVPQQNYNNSRNEYPN